MRIKQPCLNRVHLAVKICANTHCIFLKLFRHGSLPSICDSDFVPLFLKFLCKVSAYSARTAYSTNRIDKQNLHPPRPQNSLILFAWFAKPFPTHAPAYRSIYPLQNDPCNSFSHFCQTVYLISCPKSALHILQALASHLH